MHSAHDLATRWPTLDIAAKGARLRDSVTFSPGPLEQVTGRYREIAARAAVGLFRRDASVWTSDPGVKRKIANRLGWLTAPALMADSMARLRITADSARREQMSDVVLLGMGGSSLAPEVLRAVLGVAEGCPRFQMIDSTDPAAVRAVATPPERTLYILASKSGTTIEPNSLAAHFRRGLEDAGVRSWASHFIAITDEGTELAARARRDGFRDLFINPGDIGGRYSALSFFGMVPAALMGQDVATIVAWGLAMLQEAEAVADDPIANPAVALALAMGAGARAGGNKATLLLPPELEAFGLWIEQLVAESTGKQDVGIVPIAGEAVGPPDVYGADRLFIHVRVEGRTEDPARAAAVAELRAAGAPIVTIDLADLPSLGAEFVRWEIATAVASAILDINPFDEPNVQQAKDATRVLLERFREDGQLPRLQPDRTLDGDRAAMTLSQAARRLLTDGNPEAFLSLVKDGDYVALLAYLGPDPALPRVLDAFRHDVRDRTRAATMFGYGPRYLHSTGQLHKGGPNSGVFIIVTAAPEADLAIPGEPFTFATLEMAQALGDFQSLDASGRRALHLHLSSPDASLLKTALATVLAGSQRRQG
jgi:glucose-6-phosphate isomerase